MRYVIRREPVIIQRRRNRGSAGRIQKTLTRSVEEGIKAPVLLINGVERGDSGETIVKNNVILGRYTMSTRVENQKHQ